MGSSHHCKVVPDPGTRILLGVGNVCPIFEPKSADALNFLVDLDLELFHADNHSIVSERFHPHPDLAAASCQERRAYAKQTVCLRWVLCPWSWNWLVEDSAVL